MLGNCELNWNAISAVATTAAVFVALWIPARDRRSRYLEKLRSQARAAEIVSQSLGGLVKILPDVIAKIREMDGVMLDAPGKEIMYCQDECRAFIEKAPSVHELPTAHLGAGELVVSLARRWCNQIDLRLEIQRNDSLREQINWKEHSFVCSLGQELEFSANELRARCRQTRAKYEMETLPFIRRQAQRLHLRRK